MWSCHYDEKKQNKTKQNKNKQKQRKKSSVVVLLLVRYYYIIAIDDWNDPEWWKSYKQFFQIVLALAGYLAMNEWGWVGYEELFIQNISPFLIGTRIIHLIKNWIIG